MARQLRAEQTRATILTAAADLFDRHGYEATSLGDIVQHAHITRGALYFHFAAKHDLAQAILELQSSTSRRLAAELDDRGYSSLESLIRLTFAFARVSVKSPVLRAGLRLAAAGVAVRPPLRHPFVEWQDLASSRLRGAIKEHDVHPDTDVDSTAHTIVCSLVGSGIVGRALDPSDGSPRRTAELWQVLVRGLVPVTRRARYLGLAARLEREPAAA
ncbi:ScbR family autoregulator-binding transcription factor [Streptomyces sp. NPDC052309]|uniref:ScbR family autoregulator-binding transcription factor n=1 Tax=Streptomyces sp. NPDC052309 TaxID=3155421 RepID=UPI00341CE8F3